MFEVPHKIGVFWSLRVKGKSDSNSSKSAWWSNVNLWTCETIGQKLLKHRQKLEPLLPFLRGRGVSGLLYIYIYGYIWKLTIEYISVDIIRPKRKRKREKVKGFQINEWMMKTLTIIRRWKRLVPRRHLTSGGFHGN
jgi:hypothetical protein